VTYKHKEADMKHLTVDDVMGLEPCGHDDEDGRYTRPRVTKLFAGREKLSLIDILDMPNVPATDRLWVILRPGILADQMQAELACDFAASVLWIWEEEFPRDKRPHATIETKRRWLCGTATDTQLDAARTTLWTVAFATTWAAARDAAWAAVWAAARDAARAAGMAAGMAVSAATRYAAWTAENEDAVSDAMDTASAVILDSFIAMTKKRILDAKRDGA
jgi:hypothetical protein